MARRLLTPDHSIKQTEVRDASGVVRRYNSTTGYVNVSDADAKSLRAQGFTEASLTGSTAKGAGRRCRDCGFGSFFTTCSRCGGPCEREQ